MLTDGQKVIVHGDVEEFNEKLNLKVKSIAYAEIVKVEEVEEEITRIVEPLNDYVFVKPEQRLMIKRQ